MAKSKKKWVDLSKDQLQLETEATKSSSKMIGDKVIHPAEPIPDNDWVGGTWGLYFSDYEDELMQLLEQDTSKYIKKHPEDKVKPRIFEAKILTCENKEKTPEIVEAPPPPPPKVEAPPPPPPKVKMTPKVLSPPKLHSPITPETLSEIVIGSIGVLAKFEQKYDEGQKYINKHKEGTNKDLQVCVTKVTCLTCPKQAEKAKTPSPPPPDIPCPKLIDNALHPSLSASSGFELQSHESKDNKWGWMKDDNKSTEKTKYRLSIFW